MFILRKANPLREDLIGSVVAVFNITVAGTRISVAVMRSNLAVRYFIENECNRVSLTDEHSLKTTLT